MPTEPVQMTQNTLNAIKGWPQQAAVDFHTEYDASITGTVLPGSVARLNSSGKYLLGVGTNSVMPLFLFHGNTELGVVNYGGNASITRGTWQAILPAGQAMSLVGIGAYELVSTAFVTGQTYNPNTPLTSPDAGANAGKLTPGTLYTDMIVGITSRGVVNNGYDADAVAFWPFPVFPTP